MAKITRVFQKLFGSTSSAGEVGQFGSFAAGTPVTTTDPEVIQALGNFDSGWFSAVVGNNSPAIEDMNALFFLAFRQLAYVMQQGICEYDSTTVYYIDSLVLGADGRIYQSVTDDNTGNALTDTANWRLFKQKRKYTTLSANTTLSKNVHDVVLADASSGAITLTLPSAEEGLSFDIKKSDTSINKITINPDAAELIEGLSDIKLDTYLQSFTVVSDGTGWYVL